MTDMKEIGVSPLTWLQHFFFPMSSYSEKEVNDRIPFFGRFDEVDFVDRMIHQPVLPLQLGSWEAQTRGGMSNPAWSLHLSDMFSVWQVFTRSHPLPWIPQTKHCLFFSLFPMILHAQEEPENFIPVCSTLCMQNVFNHSHTHTLSLSDLWQIDSPLFLASSLSKTRDPTRLHWAISKLDNVANLKWTKKTNSTTNCQCFFFSLCDAIVLPTRSSISIANKQSILIILSFSHSAHHGKYHAWARPSQTYNSDCIFKRRAQTNGLSKIPPPFFCPLPIASSYFSAQGRHPLLGFQK